LTFNNTTFYSPFEFQISQIQSINSAVEGVNRMLIIQSDIAITWPTRDCGYLWDEHSFCHL